MSSKHASSNSFIEQARRRQIIDTTINLLAEHGYVNTSFADIAEKLGSSKSLIAYHFVSKEKLLDEVVKQISASRMEVIRTALAATTDPLERIAVMLKQDIAHMSSHIEQFRALAEISFHRYGSAGTLKFLSDNELLVYDTLKQLLAEAQSAGALRPDIDIASLAVVLDGARDAFLARYSQAGGDIAVFTKTLLTCLAAATTQDVTEITIIEETI